MFVSIHILYAIIFKMSCCLLCHVNILNCTLMYVRLILVQFFLLHAHLMFESVIETNVHSTLGLGKGGVWRLTSLFNMY